MPKVTDEYLAEKKQWIMQCAAEVVATKPLYQMTMRDIIKKTGFSQGAIYRYYGNIDEVLVDLVNQKTEGVHLKEKIDELIHSGEEPSKVIEKGFLALGKYIKDIQAAMGGKIYFEMVVMYAFDSEKLKNVLPQMTFKQNMDYAQQSLVMYCTSQIEKGYFKPKLSVESIITYAGVTIDGIANDYAISCANKDITLNQGPIDIMEMSRMLARTIVDQLEGK